MRQEFILNNHRSVYAFRSISNSVFAKTSNLKMQFLHQKPSSR